MNSYNLKILNNKNNIFDKFVLECCDELYDLVPFDGDNLFVSGGFFARKFIGAPIRDIDVYINRDEKYIEYLRNDYERLGYKINENSSITNQKYIKLDKVNEKEETEFSIDLISFHEPKNASYIETFDFDICQFAMNEDYIFTGNSSWQSLIDHKFHYTGNLGGKTIQRMTKYMKLGFNIDDISIQKIANSYVPFFKV